MSPRAFQKLGYSRLSSAILGVIRDFSERSSIFSEKSSENRGFTVKISVLFEKSCFSAKRTDSSFRFKSEKIEQRFVRDSYNIYLLR